MKAGRCDTKDSGGGRGPVDKGGRVPALDAVELFSGGREVRLRLDGEEYRLRVTRKNKLILTK